MTGQPPTNPGDVWVVGQRLQPNGLFPPPPGGGGGIPGDDGGIHQDELDPDNPSPNPSPSHPCENPATAVDWNADAAAAEAKKEFERLAAERGDDGLYSREWHAFIYQDQNGRMYLGPVVPGTINSVTPDTTGMTPDNLIGFVHNHPGGTIAPSGDDWAGFDSLYGWVAQWSSDGVSRANQLRQYIIARDANNPNSSIKIRAFDKDSSRGSEAAGQEVNPDGEQCP